MRNKLWIFSSLICILCLLSMGLETEAQENITSEMPEEVPLTEASENAKLVYTQLMYAVYLQSFNKDIKGARQVYDALVKQAPESAFVWYKSGQLKNIMQDIRGAEEDTRKALKLDPSHIPATWQLAQILVKRASYSGRRDINNVLKELKVLETLERVTELDPDHLDAHHVLSDLAYQIGEYTIAEKSLKALTRILPFEPTFHERLGDIYKNLDLPHEAIDAYQRVIKIKPDDRNALRSLGELYLNIGKLTEARQAFEKVLTMMPQDFGGNLGIGLVFKELAHNSIQSGNDNPSDEPVDILELVESAETHLLRAVSIAKDAANNARNRPRRERYQTLANRAQYNLTDVYILLKNYEKAVEVFEELLEDDPDNIVAIYGIGSVYQAMGDFKNAETYLRKTLTMQPTHANALNGLGYLYAQQGRNLDEAEALIRRALEKSPANGAYLDSLGWVYYKQGKFADAVITLESANQQLPNSVEILMHLGDAYSKTGELEKARSVWQQAQTLEPDNSDIKERLKQ